jgi:hypothetical protein
MPTEAEKSGSEVTAAVAALRIGMTRDRVVRRIQTRELHGRFDAKRGWVVSIASLDAYAKRADMPVGASA